LASFSAWCFFSLADGDDEADDDEDEVDDADDLPNFEIGEFPSFMEPKREGLEAEESW
jgi:hypothetical protein